MSRALVWNYYSDEKEGKAKCNTCEKNISCKGGTTSSLINHLKQHNDIFKEYEEKKKNKRPSSSVEQSVCKQSRVTQYFEVPLQASQKILMKLLLSFLLKVMLL